MVVVGGGGRDSDGLKLCGFYWLYLWTNTCKKILSHEGGIESNSCQLGHRSVHVSVAVDIL